jgi:hypothetical protein
MTRKKFTKSFIMHTREMIASPAWRVLSLSARRVLDRIEIELCRHGGKDNGRLPVTHQNFEDYGVHHDGVGPAIRELEWLGFIEVTQRGTAGKAEQRRPNLFRLTYVKSFGEEPTDEWMAVLTIEDAERIATAARSKVAQQRRGFRWEFQSSRSWKTRNPDPGNQDQEGAVFDPGNRDRERKTPDPGNQDVYLDDLSKSRNGTGKGGEQGEECEASPPLAFSTVSSH